MKPLSVLDFYVSEKMQRGGHGKQLFDTMLRSEGVQPAKLAYDRPSPKLKAFLAKYFKLVNHVQQNNNYVVFDDYFTAGKTEEPRKMSRGNLQSGSWESSEY